MTTPSSSLSPKRRGRLAGKRIVLGVTGSIAAFKAVLLLRLLLKEGASVDVVMTSAATAFVGPATFAGLTGKPVYQAMFDDSLGGELHVELAARADLVIVAPATADCLARLATGRADDLVTALCLCARAPILAAPAMFPGMWSHPATARNVAQLAADGRVELVGPVHGEVASGDVGVGRMVEPELLLEAAVERLTEPSLRGRHVVVTAGPTVEDVDPVRFLSNRSSGKMGYAIAARARAAGARVTLISGPTSLPCPYGVQRVDVRSALAMRSALWEALGADLRSADALIMAAAVGDYRPAEIHATKLKRGQDMNLALTENPDLLAEIGAARRGRAPVLVGFAVEADTDEAVIGYARGKLLKKRVDLVVANHASDSFGRDDNKATLVAAEGISPLPAMPKSELADHILRWLADKLEPALV